MTDLSKSASPNGEGIPPEAAVCPIPFGDEALDSGEIDRTRPTPKELILRQPATQGQVKKVSKKVSRLHDDVDVLLAEVAALRTAAGKKPGIGTGWLRYLAIAAVWSAVATIVCVGMVTKTDTDLVGTIATFLIVAAVLSTWALS